MRHQSRVDRALRDESSRLMEPVACVGLESLVRDLLLVGKGSDLGALLHHATRMPPRNGLAFCQNRGQVVAVARFRLWRLGIIALSGRHILTASVVRRSEHLLYKRFRRSGTEVARMFHH